MYNILVVEDIPAVRNVLKEVIRGLGQSLHIEEAATTTVMRRLINQQDWDCVVTDMHLQDGESLDVIREVYEKGGKLPVILVSGFLTEERRREAREVGVSHVLTKPFQPDDLWKALCSVVGDEEMQKQKNPLSEHEEIQSDRLELFAMDRQLSILNRMLTVASRQEDIHDLCSHTLALAMEMLDARKGFIALFERKKQQLVLMALKPEAARGQIPGQCLLARTPYTTLLGKRDRLVQQGGQGRRYECWADLQADRFVALPLYLEGVPMGVLCLMDHSYDKVVPNHLIHMLELLVTQLNTLLENRAVHAALAASMKETLIALVHILEARDQYTRDHSAHVSALAVRLAKNMGHNQDVISTIRVGGLLHDIGKAGIPDAVLLKTDRLTHDEFEVIKTHSVIGVEVLQHMDMLSREIMIVRHHHERWDGHGYPDGLAAEQIPLEARIVGVADAIDAMTTHRCYRKAQPLSFCLEQLKRNSGTQFDPAVARAAINAIECGQVRTQAEEKKVSIIHPVSSTA